MQKKFRCGPVALGSSVADILNPGTTTGGVNCTSSPYNKLRVLINSIRATNKTGTPATLTLYVGATGGTATGTEIVYQKTVKANDSEVIQFNGLPLDTTDFLTGLASAATTITLEIDGEIGVA